MNKSVLALSLQGTLVSAIQQCLTYGDYWGGSGGGKFADEIQSPEAADNAIYNKMWACVGSWGTEDVLYAIGMEFNDGTLLTEDVVGGVYNDC